MTALNWKGYVRCTREKASEIFRHAGFGGNSPDCVYLFLKAMLGYCIYGYSPSYNKEIAVTINTFREGESDFWIRVNGPGLHITSKSLRCAVASTDIIHHYLFCLPDSEKGCITPVVINALSRFFCISSFRNHLEAILKYEDAEEFYELVDNDEEDGIGFHIVPDKSVLGNYSIRMEPILPIVYSLLINYSGHSISIKQGLYGKPLIFISETLMQADERITNACAHKICDMPSDDYANMLPKAKAITICFPVDGTSAEIADQIISVTSIIGGTGEDAIYSVELKATDALICDSSIVIGTIQDCYNTKREVIGHDAKDYSEGNYGINTYYSNVIVSIIRPIID